MSILRIDENSTNSRISQVFSLTAGDYFSMPDNFVETFKAKLPQDRLFYFQKESPDTYVVIKNIKTIKFKAEKVSDLQK